jgi:hypothetical protein
MFVPIRLEFSLAFLAPRRHSALTEKSTKLKSNMLNHYAGWTASSNMA